MKKGVFVSNEVLQKYQTLASKIQKTMYKVFLPIFSFPPKFSLIKYSSDSPTLYAIQLLLFIKRIPLNIIHFMKTNNGAFPPEVIQRILEASKILNKMNILIKFISTDGDLSFDKFH